MCLGLQSRKVVGKVRPAEAPKVLVSKRPIVTTEAQNQPHCRGSSLNQNQNPRKRCGDFGKVEESGKLENETLVFQSPAKAGPFLI